MLYLIYRENSLNNASFQTIKKVVYWVNPVDNIFKILKLLCELCKQLFELHTQFKKFKKLSENSKIWVKFSIFPNLAKNA